MAQHEFQHIEVFEDDVETEETFVPYYLLTAVMVSMLLTIVSFLLM